MQNHEYLRFPCAANLNHHLIQGANQKIGVL